MLKLDTGLAGQSKQKLVTTTCKAKVERHSATTLAAVRSVYIWQPRNNTTDTPMNKDESLQLSHFFDCTPFALIWYLIELKSHERWRFVSEHLWWHICKTVVVLLLISCFHVAGLPYMPEYDCVYCIMVPNLKLISLGAAKALEHHIKQTISNSDADSN